MSVPWKSLWPAAIPLVPLFVEANWIELAIGLAVLGVAAILFERFPVVTLSVLVTAATAEAVLRAPLTQVWPLLAVAVYSYLAGRRVAGINFLPVLAVLPVSVLVNGLTVGLYDWFVSVLVLLVAVMAPWLVGRFRQQRTEIAAAGWERAALLERQREFQISHERARIARDMHDSLGHQWGLIALRAAALEVATDLPPKYQQLAGELRADVAHATERLHEIIVMLDSAKESTGVNGLIERSRAAGMEIDAPDDLPELAYQVVQEGLTNAAKHARGAPVTIRRVDNTVTITSGPGESGETVSSGTGLARLKEHLTVHAGPKDGGFELRATIPLPQAKQNPAQALKVPAIAAATILLVGGAFYVVAGLNNRLAPAVFDSLPVGAEQSSVEDKLPLFPMLGNPDQDSDACQRYWATEQRDDRLYYRLCFVDGRLADKQIVPRKDVP
ncbi:sensor histidine kinase [Kibdelosporangium aridum]|uniref:histidine kinase n=1 Tax=Kibdelosporangium aridum TaxID=2030 RepID=A0A1Y5XJH5_KIBAR|nr:histidine kinase [Kibdelosporangium aridum]SMC92790.1 Signal transduction histidine kinase [Kibdelosporangium aridum]